MPSVSNSAITFQLSKWIEINGIETETFVSLQIPPSLALRVFSWVHPKQAFCLRAISRSFNDFISTAEFARRCLSHYVEPAKSRDELDDVKDQINRMTGNKQPFQKPNEFQEIFFMHSSEIYKTVYASEFLNHATSLGKIVGAVNRRRVLLTIPKQVSFLVNLVKLDLGMCGMMGEIPLEVMKLETLEYLDLGRNRFTGSIPPEIKNLINLKYLDLQNNDLAGAIPKEVGSLVNLVTLLLNDNKLTGPLPSEIGKLVSLIQFDASNNKLSGRIPATIGKLLRLTLLSLNNNIFDGPIPSEIGYLSSLRALFLQKNGIEGRICKEVGRLTQLRQLGLNGNKLDGEIPSELTRLLQLEYCNLKNYRGLTCSFDFEFAF